MTLYSSITFMEVVEMTGQKKDKLGIVLLGIVHLVCCSLLLIFSVGGISIGMVTSYLQGRLVPLGVALIVIGIFWAGYRLWRGPTVHWN